MPVSADDIDRICAALFANCSTELQHKVTGIKKHSPLFLRHFSNDYQIISLAEEDLPSVFGFLEVAFRHKDFIVNGEAVPISRYLSDDSMNY